MTATPIPRTLVLRISATWTSPCLTESRPAASRSTRAPSRSIASRGRRGIGGVIAGGPRAYWICPLVTRANRRPRRRRGARQTLQRFSATGRPDARPDERARRTRPWRASARRTKAPGRHDRHRGRRRRARGDDHGDRTCRAFRPRATPSVARPGRARRGVLDLPAALQGRRSASGRARLEILRETEDGFRIAEEDLRLRGEGEVLGVRQAGAPGFRLAWLEIHGDLLGARPQPGRGGAGGERGA